MRVLTCDVKGKIKDCAYGGTHSVSFDWQLVPANRAAKSPLVAGFEQGNGVTVRRYNRIR